MNKILKNVFKNKRTLILILGLGLFLSFVPYHTNAAPGFLDVVGALTGTSDLIMAIKNLPISIPAMIIIGPLYLIAYVFGAINFAFSALLIFIVRSAMAIPITPVNQPIVAVGWEICRDLANAVFILVLAFIGLATILKVKDYEAKKLLPTLIIIAVLINFSGVLVGFVVDMGNIITNFFISKIGTFNGLNEQMNSVVNTDNILNLLSSSDVLADAVAMVAKLLVMCIYYVITVLVLFIIMLLFVARSVVLWIIAILAPLAFASYVLPSARKLWNEWWKNLVQWAIMGIPISFFLYLSGKLLEDPAAQNSLAGLTNQFTAVQYVGDILSTILSKVVALAMLMLGVMLSVQFAPAGAQGVVNWGKKQGTNLRKWAGGKGRAWARERVPDSVRSWANRMSVASTGQGRKGLGGFALRSLGSVQRGMGGIIRTGVSETGEADTAFANANKNDVISNLHDYRQAASQAQREGIMRAMVGKKQLKDAMDADIVGGNILTDDEVVKTYKKAVGMRDSDTMEGIERITVGRALKDAKGNDMEDAQGNKILLSTKLGEIVKEMTSTAVDPDDRADANGLNKKDRDRGYVSYADKIIGDAKTDDDIKQLKKGWWKNEDLMNAAQKFWGGSQIGKAATNFGKSFSDDFQADVQKKGLDWYFEIDKNTGKMRNPDAPKYLTGNGAMALGIGLAGVNQSQINNRVAQGKIIERNPDLSDAYKLYRANSELNRHIDREKRKGAPAADIKLAEQKLEDAGDQLDDNLKILYSRKPELEEAWDTLVELGKRKGKR